MISWVQAYKTLDTKDFRFNDPDVVRDVMACLLFSLFSLYTAEDVESFVADKVSQWYQVALECPVNAYVDNRPECIKLIGLMWLLNVRLTASMQQIASAWADAPSLAAIRKTVENYNFHQELTEHPGITGLFVNGAVEGTVFKLVVKGSTHFIQTRLRELRNSIIEFGKSKNVNLEDAASFYSVIALKYQPTWKDFLYGLWCDLVCCYHMLVRKFTLLNHHDHALNVLALVQKPLKFFGMVRLHNKVGVVADKFKAERAAIRLPETKRFMKTRLAFWFVLCLISSISCPSLTEYREWENTTVVEMAGITIYNGFVNATGLKKVNQT
jgi:hypothetical protein